MLRFLSIICVLAQLGDTITDRPIIGIMTQELHKSLEKSYPGHDSYIAASYVKAVEGAGGRVVPIFIGQSEAYYRRMADSINGLLIPGGGSALSGTDNFFAAAKTMYKFALEMNAKDVHFPVFGVCQGFELFMYLDSNDEKILRRCGMSNFKILPLKFSSGFKKTTLFKTLPGRISRTLKNNVTINNHGLCVYPDDFNRNNLGTDWRILATSDDLKGNPFIAVYEHVKYPISAVQFHPEKHAYEWGRVLNLPRSVEAIEAGRYFYDWFIAEARKNDNSFEELQQEQDALIYNFVPSHSDLHKLSLTQIYLFSTRYLRLV